MPKVLLGEEMRRAERDIRPYINSIIEECIIKAVEEFDKFVFETIKPYCDYVSKMEISKDVLERALTEYFKNHPEERENNAEDFAGRGDAQGGTRSINN